MSETTTQNKVNNSMNSTFELVSKMTREERVAYGEAHVQKMIDLGLVKPEDRQREMESMFPTPESQARDTQAIKDYRSQYGGLFDK